MPSYSLLHYRILPDMYQHAEIISFFSIVQLSLTHLYPFLSHTRIQYNYTLETGVSGVSVVKWGVKDIDGLLRVFV